VKRGEERLEEREEIVLMVIGRIFGIPAGFFNGDKVGEGEIFAFEGHFPLNWVNLGHFSDVAKWIRANKLAIWVRKRKG